MKCKYCDLNQGKPTFCCRTCANKGNAEKLSETRMGPGNPMYGKKPHNFKGMAKTKSGSRNVIYLETRLFGKRTKIHRYIMEQFLGRKLKNDEVVHHKDGNGLNNHVSNLVVMSKSDHSRLHADVSFLKGGGVYDQGNV